MSFRALHDALQDYEGQAAFADVLRPWLENGTSEIELLKSLGSRTGNPIPQMSVEELWYLYSAHRVLELLVYRFQPGAADGRDWLGPAITRDEFTGFARAVGLEVVSPDGWSPFHHEIVELTPVAEPGRRPEILSCHWPCLMLGPMLFMRGGVSVSAGAEHLVPGIADRSTLYWAHLRKTRRHEDLAHGWGHNSSWRTAFRRDYLLDGTFHFNLDGEIDLSKVGPDERDDHGLSPHERRELVVHRCFVTCAKTDAGLFPYDDRCSVEVEPAARPGQRRPWWARLLQGPPRT